MSVCFLYDCNPIRYFDPSGLKVYASGVEASGAAGLKIEGQVLFVTDDHGNCGYLVVVNGGAGTPNAGWGGTTMVFPTMDNINQLTKDSFGVGGGFSYYSVSTSNVDGQVGTSISAGVSILPVEFSATTGLVSFWIWNSTRDKPGRFQRANGDWGPN